MSRSPVRHASELPMTGRILAYIVTLAGYFLYCYNFVVLDYVRPYLVSEVGFSVQQTAIINSAGNIGVTIGAVVWAAVIARIGRRAAVATIAAAIGLMAACQAGSNDLATWIGSRGVLAAALGGYYVVATSIVVALFPPHVRGKLIALNSAMYALSNIAVGTLGASIGDAHWRLLLWVAVIPLPLAGALWLAVPSDRRYRAYDADATNSTATGSWREMLSSRWRWRTLGCVLLSGIDFNAYQLFFSFVTLYTKTVRHASAETMGTTVALISTGSLIGGFAWALASDRWGRRLPLTGYVLAAVAILVFLRTGASPIALSIAGFAFGVGLSCTACWGAWFAEMFPVRLQPYGASLFHAGHVLALASPLVAAFAAGGLGLSVAMSLAALVYLAGAAVWFAMPETLPRLVGTISEHQGPSA